MAHFLEPFSSPEYQKRTRTGTTGMECCLCGRQVTEGTEGALYVSVNHCDCTFVTDEEAATFTPEEDAISLFPIGPDCAIKYRKAIGGTISRLPPGRRTA